MTTNCSTDIYSLIEQFDEFDINQIGQVTASQRGQPQLYYEGYFYRISCQSSSRFDYPLVDKFREEQKKTEDLLVKLETGIQYKRKPAYILLDDRIKEIQKNYSLANFDKYYDSLSLILDY